MENAKNIAQSILYIACPIAVLLMVNNYIIEIHVLLDYLLILIISTTGSIITKDRKDGVLAGFYGSYLPLVLWLFIPFILSYFLYIITVLFLIPNFVLNFLRIILHFALTILMIFLLYKQKLHLLLYSLIILILVGYVFPITISISVEFGYMIDLEGVMQILLDFLQNVVGVIIISTISGLIGGWIGMHLLKKYQSENLDVQQN
ncbi:MAG: hypothetical protein ACFE9S_11170 [Candidatus Hermodarchaeota archaeon]